MLRRGAEPFHSLSKMKGSMLPPRCVPQEEGSLAVKEMLAAASQYQLPQSSGATQTAPLTAGAGFGSSGAQEAASPQFGLDAGAGQHHQQQQAATGRGGSLDIATIPKQAPQQQPYRGGRQQQQGQQHGGGGGAGLPATASLQQLINQMQQQQAAAEQNQHRHHNHRHHQPPAFGQGALRARAVAAERCAPVAACTLGCLHGVLVLPAFGSGGRAAESALRQ